MNKVVYFILMSLVVFLSCTSHSTKQKDERPTTDSAGWFVWQARPLPDLCVTDTQGVAGAMLTMVNGKLAIGGGANFPDMPAARGGKKKIYNTIYTLTGNVWALSHDTLPQPIAYAATASVPEGLVVLGGNNGTTQVADAYIWQNDGAYKPLPPLPHPVENAAATYSAATSRSPHSYIYIIGGQTPQVPTTEVYRLAWPDGTQWEQMPNLSGEPRVQCSATWRDGAIYVAGGYNPMEGTVSGTILSMKPGEKVWKFVDSIRKPDEMMTSTLIGGALMTCEATNRLLFIGGVDATIFQEAISRPQRIKQARDNGETRLLERLEKETSEYMLHAPEWYRFNNQLIAYDIPTATYRNELSNHAIARAGAAILKRDSVIYVVNGELKPGIRSRTATMLVRRDMR